MLKLHEKSRDDTVALMADIGRRARTAARPLAIATTAAKNAALIAMAEAIIRREQDILDANAIDISNGHESGLSASSMDRLKLDSARIRAMADGIREIAELRDPVGDVIAEWDRPNGLHIERVRTPLGVVGVIYESRPNVTADAGALCLKAGNPVILRGGSDSLNSSAAIHACLVEGLKAANLPQDAVQLVPTADRAAVGEMLKGLSGSIDVIIPRGGKNLVERVQNEARVPVFAHLEGICHLYIDRSAKLEMAVSIAVNAKMRRTGVCGAAETLLVDRAVASTHLVPILEALRAAGCAIHADAEVLKVFADAEPATDADWVTEYLDAIIAAKLVDGVAGAIDHIETFSSHHTEAIIAEDANAVERFF
ncbi:MAG: glutamate-5-semialdehyde dehydrogenase, partial [Mesorhizobium sp.]